MGTEERLTRTERRLRMCQLSMTFPAMRKISSNGIEKALPYVSSAVVETPTETCFPLLFDQVDRR